MRVVVLVKSTQRLPEDESPFEELAPCDLAALSWGRKLVSDPRDLLVLTAGPATCDSTLKRAMQLGAGRACRVWVTTPQDADEIQPNPRAIAELLAATLKRKGYDLVLAGSRSADWNSGITAMAVAFNLGVPHITGVTDLQSLGDKQVRLAQPRERALLAMTLELPAVVTTCAPAAHTPLPQSDAEAQQAIEVLDDVDLAFELEDPTPYNELPTHDVEESRPRLVANTQELIETLRALGAIP